MAACPACNRQLGGESSFCPHCGEQLSAAPPAALRERKVVTTLFCDLAGFTAVSESADPEDVDAMLAEYFAAARRQIERHGGIVEKFIGDAVVGVFGVPVAHEDDPERAVRAGLAIVEAAEQLRSVGGVPLRLRVGVNTGEAVVRVGVDPGSGEGLLVGDSVNTAARIQSIAPEQGVAVGLTTHELTAAVFDYQELEPVALKGKSQPQRVFQAHAPLARLGVDLTRRHDSPFVGRDHELAVLTGAFDRSAASNTTQIVTVVGEPGIGKSRIVAELLAHAQSREPLLTWRQGRCLPYGDGISYWALGEIVKAHAGILETDDPDVVVAKLGEALPEGPDPDWLRQRLLPLVGVEATSPADREELFAAWTTFFERIAQRSPTVLVFEDVHWADAALLAFIEQLAQHVSLGSLLVVATARPELMDTAPDFGRQLVNLTRVHLAPLADEETVALVSGVLGTTAAVPEALRDSVLSRAEGNPLYVGEFLRLLRDRQLLARHGAGWRLAPGAELSVPGSLQALIAARLDLLPAERKAMLADAAVVGKVFWAGAVARTGARPLDDVVEAMDELCRRDLVRRVQRSSMADEAEYAFWHVLTRDVAYAQLPRASRADRHAAVAGWLEDKAGKRLEDIADVLAHHYATALELARATGDADRAARLQEPAVRFLTLAGQRAAGLDGAAAITAFERAVDLAPPDDPARAEALLGFADAALETMRTSEGLRAAEEALGLFRTLGAPDKVAAALVVLATISSRHGESGRAAAQHDEALALLEGLTPSQELVTALASKSARETLAGRPEAGLELADRAIALARSHGLRSWTAMQRRGMARLRLGDGDGVDDYRDALAQALEAGEASEAAMTYLNLSLEIALIEGPRAALEVTRAGLAYTRPRGFTDKVVRMALNEVEFLAEVGELDEAFTGATELLRDAHDYEYLAMYAHIQWARILIAKGETGRIVDSLDLIAASGRDARNPTTFLDALTTCATGRAALAQGPEVVELLTEIDRFPAVRLDDYYGARLPTMVRAALAVGDVALAERLAKGVTPRWPYAVHGVIAAEALLDEARRDSARAAEQHADAADRWRAFGVVPEHAFSLLGRGRCLLALGRPAETEPVVREARNLFARMGALPGVDDCDALLAEAAV